MFPHNVTFRIKLSQSRPRRGPKVTFGCHFWNISGDAGSDLSLERSDRWQKKVAGLLVYLGTLVADMWVQCGFGVISWGRAPSRSLPAVGAEQCLATWESTTWASRWRVSYQGSWFCLEDTYKSTIFRICPGFWTRKPGWRK